MSETPIPQPKPDPIIGNLRELDSNAPIQSFMRLARMYGPIFRLGLPGQSLVVVSSQQLANEVSDETRFDKKVHSVLRHIRDFAGDGLFTAYTDEPNWGKAHRILMPVFGPIGIRDMFGGMLDIAEQMLLRWERFGENAVIDVPDQMTRLTLDTIALCGFGYRFNSFYQEAMHPFVGAMVAGLEEAGARSRLPSMATRLRLMSRRRYEADIRLMHDVADQLIAERRQRPSDEQKGDLLSRMLLATDPVTGERLTDENIRFQMVTFLIAGHETTSGLLSFTLYFLLANPRVRHAAQSLVDEILGDQTPQAQDLPKLGYLEQVLKEALRLWPTAPAFGLRPLENTTVGGGYPVTTEDTVLVLTPILHRDPKVWGPDPEAFQPSRFAPETEKLIPPNAWKPFGNGQRACIGRSFALQEAQLVLAMILQRFEIVPDDPCYELSVRETLTLKPQAFRIRARRRLPKGSPVRGSAPPAALKRRPAVSQAQRPTGPIDSPTRLAVLYGSNAGASQAFAQRIGSDASSYGYQAEVAAMDEYAGRLPKDGATIIVTASYEGQPPDNARQFVAALDDATPGELAGVRFAVFGCGNRQWARTYQAIPKRVDAALEQAGATRLRVRGEADASGDFFGAFDEWYATLWSDLAATFGKSAEGATAAPQLKVELVRQGRPTILRQPDLQTAELAENRELVNPGSELARSKRHLEFALPKGMTYRTGDYLAVLPRNPRMNVERALRRFGFAVDSHVVLRKSGGSLTTLPTGYPIAASELLANYLELAQPATRSQMRALADVTAGDAGDLVALAQEDAYRAEILGKRVSVLDLLERFPSCALEFSAFLEMLPPLAPRQYSISSSPLRDASRCSLTVAVVDAPALSGQGHFLGVASTYLASSEPGTRISVAVRPSNPRFHPPIDPQVPMVMICAGSGLAPFRGFVQERAIQAEAGQKVGRALLFFGCDHPEVDFLYREELEEWEGAGIVEVRPAFTFAPQGDVKFVQHRVWQDRADVAELFRQGALVYLCGDGRRMAPAVRETLVRIYREATGVTASDAELWADQMERERGRFVQDVFA